MYILVKKPPNFLPIIDNFSIPLENNLLIFPVFNDSNALVIGDISFAWKTSPILVIHAIFFIEVNIFIKGITNKVRKPLPNLTIGVIKAVFNTLPNIAINPTNTPRTNANIPRSIFFGFLHIDASRSSSFCFFLNIWNILPMDLPILLPKSLAPPMIPISSGPNHSPKIPPNLPNKSFIPSCKC